MRVVIEKRLNYFGKASGIIHRVLTRIRLLRSAIGFLKIPLTVSLLLLGDLCIPSSRGYFYEDKFYIINI
jgi:hypothetical protein